MNEKVKNTAKKFEIEKRYLPRFTKEKTGKRNHSTENIKEIKIDNRSEPTADQEMNEKVKNTTKKFEIEKRDLPRFTMEKTRKRNQSN